jgi:hypothetical protein
MHVGLAAAAISLLVAGVAAGSASASAYGVQYWGFFTVNIRGQSIGVPSGQLARDINGSGTYINSEWAHITTAGTHRTCSLVNGRRRSFATPACVIVWL